MAAPGRRGDEQFLRRKRQPARHHPLGLSNPAISGNGGQIVSKNVGAKTAPCRIHTSAACQRSVAGAGSARNSCQRSADCQYLRESRFATILCNDVQYAAAPQVGFSIGFRRTDWPARNLHWTR